MKGMSNTSAGEMLILRQHMQRQRGEWNADAVGDAGVVGCGVWAGRRELCTEYA